MNYIPRLPLLGSIDLTYRCNNRCIHCWLAIPADAPARKIELSFDEIRRIADEARQMGCRGWNISGGEPMLRPDFPEVFDYLTRRSASYSLNTNGTLITPEIARLMRLKGNKMVSLYGATVGVHDRVTQTSGSFEAAMRGIACLREEGAGFMLQLVPMKENRHEWEEMIALAESLGPLWRVGAAWLNMAGCGKRTRNAEIAAQRLDPHDAVELDPVDFAADRTGCCGQTNPEDDRLFAACIRARRDFHIDPYGGMSFCCHIQDPALRCNLRAASFEKAWDEFIPSLADRVRGEGEYLRNCGACDRRDNCRWCAAYAYLEHGRYTAPVPYLCALTEETAVRKAAWLREHRRFYEIGGITLQVDSDLPMAPGTFHPKIELFRVEEPGEDRVVLRHRFELPPLDGMNLGEEVFRKAPWVIHRKGNSWIYRGIYPEGTDDQVHQLAVFSADHTRGEIYHPNRERYLEGCLQSLSFYPTDQILLSRLLAERQGCILHAAGVILGGRGLIFVGHSEAGKTTTVRMLQGNATILCDDRIIVRRRPDGFWIHGTWSHGEIPDVSPASAPLEAILVLNKSAYNRIVPVDNRAEAIGKLLACLIKPLLTADWWEKSLELVEALVREAPIFEMEFDRSGDIVPMLEQLVCEPAVEVSR